MGAGPERDALPERALDSSAMNEPCTSCGGSGGGPFGRAGSAWDDETYVCPRCDGTGEMPISVRPPIVKGLAKASTPPAAAEPEKLAAGDE